MKPLWTYTRMHVIQSKLDVVQKCLYGAISDNFNKRIEQKILHAEIAVDPDKVKREQIPYKKIPVITDFTDAERNDYMRLQIQQNYNRIKADVKQSVSEELQRIRNEPEVL